MEEDLKHLEKRIDLNRQMYLEFGRLLSLDEATVNAIENLINKYKELEKVIKLMSSTIHQLAVNNDIAKYFPKRYCKTYYSGDISKCKDLICETCVKNYFRKKAKGE